MISFRYHIVSLVAMFLALGLGIVLGSSVVSAPLAERLDADVGRYKGERDEWRTAAEERESQLNTLTRRLESQVAPWALRDSLPETPVMLFVDAPRSPDWREHVLDALVRGGADPQGTVTLTRRWQTFSDDDETELVDAMQSVVPTFEPQEDVRGDALALLGQRLLEPAGRELIDGLTRDGFLSIEGRPDQEWPPTGAAIVVLSPVREEAEPEMVGASSGFATNVSASAPTLVLSESAEGVSAVTQLRDEGQLPDGLATFDSATNELDPGGLGVVAALLAAIEQRGGHFGAERGRTFIAPPAPPE